jgi:hypothetical protein
MVAPVRRAAKHLEPSTPVQEQEHARRTGEDGLPAAPWLRVHARAGGRVEKVAPTSMVVPGTVADWRRWTGLELAASGQITVPGALVPVRVSLEQDHAV